MWGRAAPGCADASRTHPTLLANSSKAKTMTSRANFTGQSPLKMKCSWCTVPLRFVGLTDVRLDVVVSDLEEHEKCLHLSRRVGPHFFGPPQAKERLVPPALAID